MFKIPKVWRRKHNGSQIMINWRMAALYLVAAVIFAWSGTALGVYLYVKHKTGFSDVRLDHIAGLPFTLESYRADKGKFWTQAGIRAAEDNLWFDAFGMLKEGLPHDPTNTEARMLLARIYLMAGRQDKAANVLVEGLDYIEGKEEYLHSVLSLLFTQQADGAIVELTEKLIGESRVTGKAFDTASGARLYALFNRDRFDEIDGLLRGRVEGSVESKFIKARMAWELGNRETALSIMRGLGPADTQEAEIYRTYSYYLQEMGRIDERRRLAISRLIKFPRESVPYLDLVSVAVSKVNAKNLESAVDDYLKVFASSPDELVPLARLAAVEGLPEIAWRVVPSCPAGSVQARSATIFALEAELNSKSYAAADTKSAKVLASSTDWPAWQRQILQSYQGVAWMALGKTTDGQGQLVGVLDGGPMPPAAYASLAKQIQRAGDPILAGRFYRRALAIDASQGGTLVELLEIELQAGTLENSMDLVERLPEVRKPSAVFMSRLVDHLESDRYLYVPARSSAIDKLDRRLEQMRAKPRF
jgi:tetratricopeptide (TPR) repeat protein